MPGSPPSPAARSRTATTARSRAALREAAEETGLDPAGVDVLGTLPELFISRSQFRVVPVLAWWREPSAVRPVDIGEVAAVERISVADLADPANRLMLGFPSGHSGPAFRIGSMLIWGFTGLHHRPAARSRRLGTPVGRRDGPGTAAGCRLAT